MPSQNDSAFPVGARVHHANCLWNAWFDESQRRAKPSWGWGTVIDAEPAHGPYGRWTEVKVRYDAPMFEGGSLESWWPSGLIDRVEAPVSA